MVFLYASANSFLVTTTNPRESHVCPGLLAMPAQLIVNTSLFVYFMTYLTPSFPQSFDPLVTLQSG